MALRPLEKIKNALGMWSAISHFHSFESNEILLDFDLTLRLTITEERPCWWQSVEVGWMLANFAFHKQVVKFCLMHDFISSGQGI